MDFTPFASWALPGWQHAVLLGGWFGALHAFDADHVATLGGIAAGTRRATPVAYALRWAAGHAAALGIVALLVFGLGLSSATAFSVPAEVLVGAALVVIGAQLLASVRERHPTLASAGGVPAIDHDDTPADDAPAAPQPARARFTIVALGLMHGTAGSATVLALLPLAAFDTGFGRPVYLVCFSLGVATGATVFAWLFARFAESAAAAGTAVGTVFKAAVGTIALVSGVLLIVGLSSNLDVSSVLDLGSIANGGR